MNIIAFITCFIAGYTVLYKKVKMFRTLNQTFFFACIIMNYLATHKSEILPFGHRLRNCRTDRLSNDP